MRHSSSDPPSRRRRHRFGWVAVFTGAAVLSLTGGFVFAGTGLRTPFWSGSNFNLSTSQNSYSNAVAWWQNILNSTAKCVPVNAVFGTVTKNATISWQQDLTFGYTPPFTPTAANGIVDADDYNAMQFAKAPEGIYRHQYAGYTDGYGTEYHRYYGGGKSALMGWNEHISQHFFNPYRISQGSQTTGWTLIAASSNRTISSYPCAA